MDINTFTFFAPSILVIGYVVYLVFPVFVLMWFGLVFLSIKAETRLGFVVAYLMIPVYFGFGNHQSLMIPLLSILGFVFGVCALFEVKRKKKSKAKYVAWSVIVHSIMMYFLWTCILTSSAI